MEEKKCGKKKIILAVAILLAIVIIVLLLKSCGTFGSHKITFNLNNGTEPIVVELKAGEELDLGSIITSDDLGEGFLSWYELVTTTEEGIPVIKDEPFDFENDELNDGDTLIAIHEGDEYIFEKDYNQNTENGTEKEEENTNTTPASTPVVEVSLSCTSKIETMSPTTSTTGFDISATVKNTNEKPVWSAEGAGISVDQNGHVTIDMQGREYVEGKVTVSVAGKTSSCEVYYENELSLSSEPQDGFQTTGAAEVTSNIPVNWTVTGNGAFTESEKTATLIKGTIANDYVVFTATSKAGQTKQVTLYFTIL